MSTSLGHISASLMQRGAAWPAVRPPCGGRRMMPMALHPRVHGIGGIRSRALPQNKVAWPVVWRAVASVPMSMRKTATTHVVTSATAVDDIPLLTSSESAMVERLQALLELHDEAPSAQVPSPSLTQQIGLQLVTTSHHALAPEPSGSVATDTLAEEAEEGGGDGMAVRTAPPPPAGLTALPDGRLSPAPGVGANAGETAGHVPRAADSPQRAAAPTGAGPGRPSAATAATAAPAPAGPRTSALLQLQARSAFEDMRDEAGSASRPTARFRWQQATRGPRDFDPTDTLDEDDDEDDDDDEPLGLEAAVLMPPELVPGRHTARLWGLNMPGGPPTTFGARRSPSPSHRTSMGGAVGLLGKMSSKIASKVGGFSKAVAQSVAEPWAGASDVVGSAAAAAAASLPAPAVAAAAAAAKSARSAVQQAAAGAASATASVTEAAAAKLAALGGAGGRSSWVVVDAPPGSMAGVGAADAPVRVIAVTAGLDVTRAIAGLAAGAAAGSVALVPFESAKLGVRVPQAVHAEASAMYSQLLPLVMDFVSEHPSGQICFTGRGPGGSLATVLGLMAAARGLRPHCLAPAVIAFDSPPVLAEVVGGALWGCGGTNQDACDPEDWEDMVADVTARGLLSELGLPRTAVLNVVSVPSLPSATSAPVAAGTTGPHTAAARALQAAAAAAMSRLNSLTAAAGGGNGTAAAAALAAVDATVHQGSIDEEPFPEPSKKPTQSWSAAAKAMGDGSGADAGAQRLVFKLVGQVRLTTA